MSDADYELVPVTPVRRLQKELEELRQQVRGSGSAGQQNSSELTNQILEILRLNQKIVDDLTTKHTDLMGKLSETNSQINDLSENVASLVTVLSSAAEDEVEPRSYSSSDNDSPGLTNKLDKIVDQNAALINSLNVLGKELGRIDKKK